VRVLGVDFGRKRIGLALSDETATLASPWRVIQAGGTPTLSAVNVAGVLTPDRENADKIGEIVVGLPRRLNGEDNEQTQPAREFAAVLAERTGLTVTLQDERLSSHEAESRLAVREKDWRRRKARLDAAAAAVILQDFLDGRASRMKPSLADHDSESSDT